MSLKKRLRLSIVALVVTVVVALSLLHVNSVIESRFQYGLELATIGGMQVDSFILQIVDEQTANHQPPPETSEDLKKVWSEIVEQDAGLAVLLQKLTGSIPVVVEILVTGENDRILSASFPSLRGQKVQVRPSFDEFNNKPVWEKLQEVLAGSRDYEVVRKPLGASGEQEPVITVRVVLNSVLLRGQILPSLRNLAVVSSLALLLSLGLAIVASNIALRPLARIGEIVDRITRGEHDADAGPPSDRAKEVAAVESKLDVLGEQFRGAQADRAHLQANIHRLLERLEEAVLLFGPDDRLIMAGRAAERLLGGRWELMSAAMDDIFPSSTALGALVQGAVHLNRGITDRPITLDQTGAAPAQLLVSVEIIEDFGSHERRGTMVTLRDADPRRQIESQLNVASRLASISRLTSGAAHEIKNPLNSIALHLEVLKTKLDGSSADAAAEMEVIGREIRRLDRVVKSFLDFTRPVDVKMERVDLVSLLHEVTTLVRPHADRQKVRVDLREQANSAPVQGDRDLLIQAILNVVVNGIQAMEQGGRLQIRTELASGACLVTIRDQGGGIPDELRNKIYNLHFTTKSSGSGIGLAMTFRVVQLHGGTIDFTSRSGEGTEFQLRFPAIEESSLDVSAAANHESSAGSASIG